MTNPASTSPGAVAVEQAGERRVGISGLGVGLPAPRLHTVANGVASRIAARGDVCDDYRMCPSVLIVDDHPGFRARARAVLESEGFEVLAEAADGASGVRSAAELGSVDAGLWHLEILLAVQEKVLVHTLDNLLAIVAA